jgi:hypothetical protein
MTMTPTNPPTKRPCCRKIQRLRTFCGLGLLIAACAITPTAWATDSPVVVNSSTDAISSVTPPQTTAVASPVTEASPSAPAATEDHSQDELPIQALALGQGAAVTTSNADADLAKLYELLHAQDRRVGNELRDEAEVTLQDIAMLWQAAIERSATLRYAIDRMSYRDLSGKPVKEDSTTKKILKSLAQVGGAAGAMWTGSPASLMGGNLVQEMLQDPDNAQLQSRVTDADMLLLAKEIENLQNQMIQAYFHYRHAKESAQLNRDAVLTLNRYQDQYQHQAETRPDTAATVQAVTPLLTSLVDSATQEALTSQQELAATRNALALIVGPEAVVALETEKPAASSKGS